MNNHAMLSLVRADPVIGPTFEWKGAVYKHDLSIMRRGVGHQLFLPDISAMALPKQWFVNQSAAYLARVDIDDVGMYSDFTIFSATGQVHLHFNATPSTNARVGRGPELIPQAEIGFRIELKHATAGTVLIHGIADPDMSEPYVWTPPNDEAVEDWVDAVANGDNVDVKFSVGNPPPPPPASVSFGFTPASLNRGRAGQQSGYSQIFDIGGQRYQLEALWTDETPSEIQFRFDTADMGRAFRNANLIVSFAPSLPSVKSGDLKNEASGRGGSLSPYGGHFTAGTTYVVTITEGT